MGWLLGIVFLLVIVLVVVGSVPPRVRISEDRITIGRFFPKRLLMTEIDTIELKSSLPTGLRRRWGYDIGEIKKGSFYSVLGPVELSIYVDYPPFIHIRTQSGWWVINNPNTELTQELFENLRGRIYS